MPFSLIDYTTNSTVGKQSLCTQEEEVVSSSSFIVCLQFSHYLCSSLNPVSAPESYTKQREKLSLLECLAC